MLVCRLVAGCPRPRPNACAGDRWLLLAEAERQKYEVLGKPALPPPPCPRPSTETWSPLVAAAQDAANPPQPQPQKTEHDGGSEGGSEGVAQQATEQATEGGSEGGLA